jgi:hypothetical protein
MGIEVPQYFLAQGTTYQTTAIRGDAMLSHSDERTSIVCSQIKKLGYARSKRVRIYGEEFEIVSDPFPEGDGIAIQVTTRTNLQVRTLRLPLTVLHGVKGRHVSREAA